jgi:uncharacterized protein (DUF2147 family)
MRPREEQRPTCGRCDAARPGLRLRPGSALRFVAGVTGMLLLWPGAAAATGNPAAPVGRWQVFDDKTGKPHGVVRIWADQGRLFGAVEKLPDDKPVNAKCLKCSGALRDKPVLGMVVLRNMSPDGGEWSGGQILDPENGKVYKCKLRVSGKDTLEVRGYIGLSLFGRTQTWKRIDSGGGRDVPRRSGE